MKKLTLAAMTAGFLCATAAVAAPIPTSTTGIGQAASSDVVQVKMKKKKMSKKKMMNQGDMNGQGGAMQGGAMQGGAMGDGTSAAGGSAPGQQMKGGTNSPNQGGGR